MRISSNAAYSTIQGDENITAWTGGLLQGTLPGDEITSVSGELENF
jgi:hypothetical protein